MQLAQPLSFQDQAQLYNTTSRSAYVDPFLNQQNPRKEASLAETWEKFNRLNELFVTYDRHKSNAVTIPELITLTSAVGLSSEMQATLSKIVQKIEAGKEGRYPYDRCFRGLAKLNYPEMTQLPVMNYKSRDNNIACTLFRGSLSIGDDEDQIPPSTIQEVNNSLAIHLKKFNVSCLMLDPTRCGYISKPVMKILLKAYNLHDGRASYILSRLDSSNDKRIPFVEFYNRLIKTDYETFRLEKGLGPNPVVRHKHTVVAMSARSNYTGSLGGSRAGGSSMGDKTERTSDSIQSHMSTMSTSTAMSTGNWPGHRQMTYSSPGSNRSEKMVPRLPTLSPTEGGLSSLGHNDGSYSMRSGMSGRSDMSTSSNLPFMKRSPSKGKLKFTLNTAKLGGMKHGKLYKQLNDLFLNADYEGHGFLSREEIRGIAVRLGMEAFESVFDDCSLSSDGQRISWVDFSNGLKQKFEPGMPSVYSGATPKRPGNNTSRSSSGQDTGRGYKNSSRGGINRDGASKSISPTKYRSPPKADDGIAAFADELGRLDVAGTGRMGPGEIRGVCRNFAISEDSLDDVMSKCSVDGSGKLSYMEFVNVLKNELSGGTYSRTPRGREQEQVSPMQQHGYVNDQGGGSPGDLRGPPMASSLSPNANKQQLPSASPELISQLHAKYAHLNRAFEHSDPRQSGYLPEKEIRRLCQIYHLPLEMIERALQRCDTGSNGLLSYTEFSNNVVRLEIRKLS
jgi:Ca2+-binding EF-hand superfamily protein